ncbi:hypothetical protein TU73_20260 [Pseudomonas libanensis]|uniref:Uncharacterized protein n=1 Tax=Pseudomonas libanensis TaxID=75588 RepID=A0A0R2Y4R4_9PSED|nr:hypothetical protein TU73_20260 [Pseudomonas libanensis]
MSIISFLLFRADRQERSARLECGNNPHIRKNAQMHNFALKIKLYGYTVSAGLILCRFIATDEQRGEAEPEG